MVFEPNALDATLSAAAGDDGALYRELRAAFVASLATQIDLLRRARCDGNWLITAQRIKSLASSFHTEPLMALADRAIEAVPGDPAVLRALQTFHDGLATG